MAETLPAGDREILRALAATIREIAELPEMAERKQRLYDLNALRPQRPIVLCFPEGAWGELCSGEVCTCESDEGRGIEHGFRRQLYWWEHIRDDHVIEPTIGVGWHIGRGDFGVTTERTYGENRGSYRWEHPIKDLSTDLDKLKHREFSVDRESTAAAVARMEELFDGLLDVKLAGGPGGMGMTWTVIDLIGLEKLMSAMIDEPENLHRLMSFMHDDYLAWIAWMEAEGLLTVNNTNGYVCSGGVAYTDELPQGDWSPGDPVRLKDLWGFAESQETVGVSPTMFGEFIFPYQLPLVSKFGLNTYGCCEGVHERWEYIKQIPNLRRVSVAPWCDQEKMAEYMGGHCVFSRKPNPAMICTSFDEDYIRADLRETLAIAGQLPLEIIMKDTHTVQNHPERITRWVQLALEEVDRYVSA